MIAIQRQTNCPQSQCRIRGERSSAAFKVLIRSEIECPDGHRHAVERFDQLAVSLEMLVLVRFVVPIHIQELCTVQTDARGADISRGFKITWELDISQEFHVLAVQCYGRRAAQSIEAFAVTLVYYLLLPVVR